MTGELPAPVEEVLLELIARDLPTAGEVHGLRFTWVDVAIGIGTWRDTEGWAWQIIVEGADADRVHVASLTREQR